MTVYISTNFVLIESTLLSILSAGSHVQWQKCEREGKERRSVRQTEISGNVKVAFKYKSH